ncbi:hypothetical protein D187_007505 [Cystobacter fuscus DSM 2262]|uniref:Uncharacterized protein n=1 Tax=Cystobacter fuscus (strain ATCC 25194 / DSM 2262 / NBRC 100088 / M29) TaxID=1242864 RepID=S9QI96_CYSF2|nr:hypothetical protein [Cystobacter fuscus]EPX56163.1 hypothetical protein D187_007505 [Cystobacter fuscus DSM 2262]
MALHPSLNDFGAYLSAVGTLADASGPKGYSPATLAANTYTDGDAFSLEGARSAVLTAMTGTATGNPTAQSHVFTMETSAGGDNPTWTAYEGASVSLTGNEKSGRVDFSLGRVPAGHTQARVKVVVGFTDGTSPKQTVAAHVVLGGYETLPAPR